MPKTKCLVCKAINSIRENEKHPSESNTRDMLRCILKAQEAIRIAIDYYIVDKHMVDRRSCAAHNDFIIAESDLGAAMDNARGTLKIMERLSKQEAGLCLHQEK